MARRVGDVLEPLLSSLLLLVAVASFLLLLLLVVRSLFALAAADAAEEFCFFTEFRRFFCDDGISFSILVENNNNDCRERCKCCSCRRCVDVDCMINDDDDEAVPNAVDGGLVIDVQDVDRA